MKKEGNMGKDNEENSIWAKGSFTQSISSEEFEAKRDTFSKSHDEDMNFNCKKCNQRISSHNKDWHDKMCDNCFNKTYFPEEYEEIESLIEKLKKYDNEKGYKLGYEDVKKKLGPVIKKLSYIGKIALEFLYPLLKNEETWSCLFALEILKEIKDEQSISYLIEFIKNNEERDYWESCEEAMYALQNIGKPAVNLLLNEVKKDFENKEEYSFLIGALTSIKDERVYNFMIEIVKGYIKDYKKYDGWLDIHMFVADFDKQENKEILPLLKQLANMDNLSKSEKNEILDTIKVIEDPEKFREETKKEIEKAKESLKDFEKFERIFEGNSKATDINKDEFLKRANEADEDFEANFICKDCNERQNIKTGIIWDLNDGKNNTFSFEYEIMCRQCHNHNMELSQEGKMEIQAKQMRMLMGNDKGVMPVGNKIIVEGKELLYSAAYDYILKRLKEEPENGELYLRAANTAEKFNKYKEAIEFYEKSIQLNNKLIASYINLIEVYLYRYEYYGISDAGQKAMFYFSRLAELFNSNNYDTATIRDKEFIRPFLIESAKRLGLNIRTEKIGRNEPCLCGSGKKYKKCCLGKENISKF